MKAKAKSVIWYHLFIDFGDHNPGEETFKQLRSYLLDKKKELQLTSLFQASYLDHLHLLYSAKATETPSAVAEVLIKAISWFLKADKGDSDSFIKNHALISVSPHRVNDIISYFENHVDHHTGKSEHPDIEKTAKQWREWEKSFLSK
jgi:hypothetical protein